ncbi:SctD/MshK family protein [Carnimonas bestiolae]|uniref:FHA domain-containing protein n=1 Tax=Carnimonas bestiolae TaxID=3402172 RepID=UPI003EDC2D25
MPLPLLRHSSSSLATPVHARLTVEQGRYAGVAVDIEQDSCVVGSGSQADIVLRDRDVASQHVRFRFHGNMVAIEAIDYQVELDHTTLAAGSGQRRRLPVHVSLGGVALTLALADSPSAPSQQPIANFFRSRHRSTLLISALVLVLLAALAVVIGSSFARDQPAASQPSPASRAPNTNESSADTLDQVVAEVTGYLHQHGANGITASNDNGRILLSGTINEDQSGLIGQIEQWFDTHYGDRFMLTSTVSRRAAVSPPPLLLRAVWYGHSPYAVDSQGKRLYPGASVGDGWVIDTISRNGVTLKRDDQHFTMTF